LTGRNAVDDYFDAEAVVRPRDPGDRRKKVEAHVMAIEGDMEPLGEPR